MSNSCSKCGGAGLVGAGENPAARLGPVTVCPDCKGKGLVEDKE